MSPSIAGGRSPSRSPHSPAATSFWQENVGILIYGFRAVAPCRAEGHSITAVRRRRGRSPLRRSRWMDCFVASLLATTRGGVALYPWETKRRHCERSEACVDGPSLARSGGGFFGRAFACVHVSGLLMQPRLLAKMASAGGRSKQSSDLDRPLLRAVYLPLRIERSRPSSFLLQARQRRARMSFRTRRSRQAAAIALPPARA